MTIDPIPMPTGATAAPPAAPSRTATVPYRASPTDGLTAAEVAERVSRGLVNAVPDVPSRTVKQIIRANVFTRFNALMGSLLAIVMICRAWRDGLFGGVIIANTAVGIIQELRAKRTLDRLAVLNAPRAQAVRDAMVHELAVGELVLDDVLEIVPGQQIVADSIVLTAEHLEIDESLLTGESDPVVKQPGDALMAGSFVVAGTGRAQVDKVGAEAYAVRLAEEARRFTLVTSELRNAVNRIVTVVTWLLVPIGIALFISQARTNSSTGEGLVSAVGGVVAMVPEGLVLLTSVAFAVGAVRLAKHRTLVQELPAIEVLARVTVLCLDKTGTLTTGSMEVTGIDPLPGAPDGDHIAVALAATAWSDPQPNATQHAIRRHLPDDPGLVVTSRIPFSSARKWSAASFEGQGTWIVGAPEIVLGARFAPIAGQVDALADAGKRVVVLAHCARALEDERLPDDVQGWGLVILEDTVRPDAPETLAYFAKQGVTLKVISGDNPRTVAAVCRRAGLTGADTAVDARQLPDALTDSVAFSETLENNTVFGRVTPHQKRAMVQALRAKGHVVAMTGDGVNDVLALKDADCGIAMASGSEATRAVAQLVLLDDAFASLPRVVDEGRRVINNIERVASLFLVKTVYAVVFALATVFGNVPFPFLPRHLTLIGSVTIGVPAFFLALEPNTELVRTGFLSRVARIAIPGGLVTSAAGFTVYMLARAESGVSLSQERTAASLVLGACALVVLATVARPLTRWKIGLIAVMATFLALTLVIGPLERYFELVDPPRDIVVAMVAAVGVAIVALPFAIGLADRVIGALTQKSRRSAKNG
jgi:cation-transporting P-type ATPase E